MILQKTGSFFSTLGAKGFYPINKTFGIGAFIQGTYYFSNFTDDVAGTNNNSGPFTTDLKVKNLFDVNFGVGFQATIPYGIKIICGPLYLLFGGKGIFSRQYSRP